MSVYPQQNNAFSQSPASLEYDLQFEKEIVAERTEEIKKEIQGKWNKKYADAQIFPDSLTTMNRELINFLLDFKNTLFYNDLAKKFNLNEQQRDLLPSVVWDICKNKKWETTEISLRTNISLSPEISNQIATLINQKILPEARSLANKPSAPSAQSAKSTALSDKISLTISEALRQYPNLGEQLITANRIKIKNFPEPARPSLKNWLADYAILMGRETHNAVERSSYLFQSENGKSLSSSDRQRLNYIFKCLDENTPITINKSTQQVVFPQISEENNSIPTPEPIQPPIEPKSNIQTIQFSYPQKTAYSKPSPPVVIPKTEVKNVLGPNVVNLKE